MSGGAFNYDQMFIQSIKEELQERLDKFGAVKTDDEIKSLPYGWLEKYPEEKFNDDETDEFKQFVKDTMRILDITYERVKAIDWHLSRDGDVDYEYFKENPQF